MAQLTPEQREILNKEKARNNSNTGFLETKNMTVKKIRLFPLDPEHGVGTKRVQWFINKKFFVCPEGTFGKPGIVIRAVRALEKLNDNAATELAEAFNKNHGTKYLMRVLDRDDNMVKWFPAPWSVYKDISDLYDVYGDIGNVKDGRDVRVSKEGSGLNGTKYKVHPLDPGPLADTKEERTPLREKAASMNPLEQCRLDEQGALDALIDVIPTSIWKKIESIVLKDSGLKADSDGDDDADASDDEDEDTPPKKPAKKPAKPAADDDDEDAEPVKKPAKAPAADEDDEDAVPAKKPAKPPVADDDDDEDKPVVKKPKVEEAKVPAKKPKPPADDEDEDSEPAPKKPAKPAADDDDADDGEAKPPKTKVGKTYKVEDDE